MTVAVLVPWQPGCPHREAAWAWVRQQYAQHHPDWQLVTGQPGPEGFSRSQCIAEAARNTDADMLVIADADVWCDGIADAVEHADGAGWAIPHWLIHRLSQDSTTRVLDGEDWHGLALSHDNRQDSKPYVGHETGTLVVMRRDVLDEVPFDPRFTAWGQEDDAEALALHLLIGAPWRGRADCVHLWHPPQPRRSRTVGSTEGLALFKRYARARRDRDAMRALIEEARCQSTLR